MIRYIKGTYTMQFESGIVVETGSGIGLEIFIPQGSPFYKHSEGDEVQIYTKMIVREDNMSLYGFHNRESLEFFNLLTGVSGIGPKGAMAIIGSMPLEQLKQAIAFGDIKAVSQAQGVGKKTAERLVVELKDKIGYIESDGDGALSVSDINGVPDSAGDARTEAVSALVSLGYTKQEAFAAISHINEEGLSSEEYIKKALKNLF